MRQPLSYPTAMWMSTGDGVDGQNAIAGHHPALRARPLTSCFLTCLARFRVLENSLRPGSRNLMRISLHRSAAPLFGAILTENRGHIAYQNCRFRGFKVNL